MPPIWKSGMALSATSSGVSLRDLASATALAARASFLIGTTLGVAVLPDVRRSSATSSGPFRRGSAARPAAGTGCSASYMPGLRSSRGLCQATCTPASVAARTNSPDEMPRNARATSVFFAPFPFSTTWLSATL